MVKDSNTGDFGNYDFSRKNQNFEWKTTLRKRRTEECKLQKKKKTRKKERRRKRERESISGRQAKKRKW